MMKKISIQTSTFILGAIILASCSTNKMAMNNTQDNLYFMASDAKIATEFAVQNNNPEQFESLSNLQPEAYPQENFSSRNVNPDYIARYQTESVEGDEGIVYFDEAGSGTNQTSEGNIDAYNNFRVGGSGMNSGFNPAMSFNMGMMYGMGMMNPWMSPFGMGGFGMSPFGMGGFGMSPFGMGGFGMNPFYDPFWGPSFGYRPGFNLSLGFGLGFGNFGRFNPFWGNNLGMGWGNPFYGGYPGWGNRFYAGRPIYVLPGGEFGDRRVVRAARPTRGSSLTSVGRAPSNAAIQPNTARAQARRDVLNNGSRRSITNANNARTSSRDFGTSQNDYYSNSRSRISTGNTRNVGSPAMDRSVSRSRSAMPSARPSAVPNNSRIYTGPTRGGVNRSSSPSYNNNRSTNPSYNRSTSPVRSGTPAYNSRGTNSRIYNTPSRSSQPTYSPPSRSSSGGGTTRSSGGGSSSGGTRGGRGN